VSNVERFESVMAERLGQHAIIKVEGEYVQPAMRLALIAWQASRRAALEGCAKALADDYKSPQFLSPVTVLDCVDFIRAFAKETNNG
jgi:hypothetical protein